MGNIDRQRDARRVPRTAECSGGAQGVDSRGEGEHSAALQEPCPPEGPRREQQAPPECARRQSCLPGAGQGVRANAYSRLGLGQQRQRGEQKSDGWHEAQPPRRLPRGAAFRVPEAGRGQWQRPRASESGRRLCLPRQSAAGAARAPAYAHVAFTARHGLPKGISSAESGPVRVVRPVRDLRDTLVGGSAHRNLHAPEVRRARYRRS